VPYIVATWASVAALGPSTGPVLGGFSAAVYGWRWTEWEILWLAGPTFIVMLFCLPETSASTILLRRAKRLRRISGDPNIKSQSEIDQKSLSIKAIAFDALIKPWQINALDPAILFTTFFTGLVYGLLYTYFEVFPTVYGQIYHFEGGELDLAYLSNLVGVGLCFPIYIAYYRFIVEPKTAVEGEAPPEHFLYAGIWSCWFLPIGLFIFGMCPHCDLTMQSSMTNSETINSIHLSCRHPLACESYWCNHGHW
jgi:DHA1 family multidrug resistance protein-like MFS transporter